MSRFVLTALVLCAILAFVKHPSSGSSSGDPGSQTRTSPFRYAIIYNDLRNPAGGTPYRYLLILIERDSFSEQNLRELFKLLNHRFPQPIEFDAYVEISLDNIQTPEEHDWAGISEGEDDTRPVKYSHANIRRSQKVNQIWIAIPTATGWSDKTIILGQTEK